MYIDVFVYERSVLNKLTLNATIYSHRNGHHFLSDCNKAEKRG